MPKLPLQEGIYKYSNIAIAINELYDSLFWIMPTINPDCGKVEPPAEFLRDGMLAYANHVDWAPGAQKGIFRYNLNTTTWDLVG